jgi:hypothetical protein
MSKWRVRLGHEVVEVEANNRTEAIKLAREALTLSWPRHYDMIMCKDDSEFKTERLT